MSFKIGFTAQTEQDEQRMVEKTSTKDCYLPVAKKSVVDVYFADRHFTCSYYNDTVFDAGHYQSENIIVNPLCQELKTAFCDIEFTVFNNDKIKSV